MPRQPDDDDDPDEIFESQSPRAWAGPTFPHFERQRAVSVAAARRVGRDRRRLPGGDARGGPGLSPGCASAFLARLGSRRRPIGRRAERLRRAIAAGCRRRPVRRGRRGAHRTALGRTAGAVAGRGRSVVERQVVGDGGGARVARHAGGGAGGRRRQAGHLCGRGLADGRRRRRRGQPARRHSVARRCPGGAGAERRCRARPLAAGLVGAPAVACRPGRRDRKAPAKAPARAPGASSNSP